MKTLHLTAAVCGLLLASLAGDPAMADVFNMPPGQKSLELVTVGDPGNPGDPRLMDDGTSGYGSVPYTYQIGTYDVTVSQYCQFLNAVAKEEKYGLYSVWMAPGNFAACGITRTGTQGYYVYTVSGDPNYPVTDVSWSDAARFCNWLENGQPVGPQGPGTTETGSYALEGVQTIAAMMAVTRNSRTRYVIPTENEWYKAAYYRGGSANAGYWLYPTRSDGEPSNVLTSTGINNANYWNNGYSDPTNYLTPVGTFAGSPGPYGTYDQGGNVWQWNEATFYGQYRGLRGGCWISTFYTLQPFGRDDYLLGPYTSNYLTGFRIALVPEPITLSLLALGGLPIARRRRV